MLKSAPMSLHLIMMIRSFVQVSLFVRGEDRMKFKRSGGILLHPTSLPGPYGIGDLGPQAYHFVDWLASTGCKLWQVLPLGPTG
ncbi:MAG TPA: 4-alpha-glucanotransferase, partial [Anaerolineales bacterium]|nr:4-alpha-glucanotransferase [Anaerolineales bacterium]